MKTGILLTVLIIAGICIFVFLKFVPPFGKAGTYTTQTTTEKRYKVEQNIKNADDFISFLKTKNYALDNFRDQNNEIVWNNVKNSVVVSTLFTRKIYSIKYKPNQSKSADHKVVMSSDGYVLEIKSIVK